MEKNLAIQASGISKRYNLGIRDLRDIFRFFQGRNNHFHWALKNVDLKIPIGKTVGLIGANGAGKSTLLKVLSKVTTPTTGTFKIRGKISSLLEAGVGFHPEYTGIENVLLQGAYLGMSAKEVKAKLPDIINFSGIGKYANTPIKRYSSGMSLRLATASALFLNADILLLDEILSVADTAFREKYSQSLKAFNDSHQKTILFVSHNLELLSKSCDAGILIYKGKAKYYDNFHDCLNAYHQEISIDTKSEQFPIVFKTIDYHYEIIDIDLNNPTAFEPFKIDITYRVIQGTEDINFGLGLWHNGQTTSQISFDSSSQTNKISSKRGKFRFVSEYNILPCNPGRYELKISLWNKMILESVWPAGLHFDIKGTSNNFSGNTTGFRIPSTRCENIEL